MKKTEIPFFAALWMTVPFFLAPAFGQSSTVSSTNVLLDFRAGVPKRVTPTSEQVTISPHLAPALPGLAVEIQPGKEDYPGLNIKPKGAFWNLSSYGHVEAHVVNTGSHSLSLALRVDNAGDWHDNPWNTENVTLEPGASGTVRVLFGYSYGHKPGYALKPASVVNLLLFTGKSDAVQSFRLESLTAGGPAGEKPTVASENVRVKPANGILLGAGVVLNPATQVASQGAQALPVGADKSQWLLVFPASQSDQSISVKPSAGRWDLRDFLEVHVRVRNEGKFPVTPRVRLDTNGGPSDWAAARTPLTPGSDREIIVPFSRVAVPDLSRPETVGRVTSDAAAAITIGADDSGHERRLRIESVQAVLPASPMPAWLGKRPPVAGDWVKTLDDEFNGASLNSTVWSIYGANYWDKMSHWSKNNVLLGKGVVRLRYQKKTGPNNDDPTQKPTEYASGYLHTYGKWVQRYGYFEARMKLPASPGLWPAFWMMPDRGPSSGAEQGNRQDTANGGMEFDIMEHLTRWGPHRYNIAMHWDGYGKDHKSLGSDKIYVQPDAGGFITCGLLWTPGSAIYYCNGKEVLAMGECPHLVGS